MVEELESGGAESGDDMGGHGSESDASSQRPTLSECSSQVQILEILEKTACYEAFTPGIGECADV